MKKLKFFTGEDANILIISTVTYISLILFWVVWSRQKNKLSMKNSSTPKLLLRCALMAGFALSSLVFSSTSHAQAAGLLAGGAEKLPPLQLSVVKPLAEAPLELKSGQYYKIEIICDGSAELALGGADFFRNVWVDEVVINDIEVRPMGLSSLEFDDEGTAEIKFIAIRPGAYELRIPGTKGESQRVDIIIK